MALFRKKDHIFKINPTSEFGILLKSLAYNPIILSEAIGMQAVQFAPIALDQMHK